RSRRRARSHSVWMGAPDVCRCGQKAIGLVYVGMEKSIMKPLRTHNLFVVTAALAAMVIATAGSPQARSNDSNEKQIKNAAEQSAKAAKAFEAIMQVPDKAIPRDLLARAKAIAVFPRVIKVALTIGGEGGRGVVSQHTSTGWANHVFLRAVGGSVGPPIGASSTDFFLLLMND